MGAYALDKELNPGTCHLSLSHFISLSQFVFTLFFIHIPYFISLLYSPSPAPLPLPTISHCFASLFFVALTPTPLRTWWRQGVVPGIELKSYLCRPSSPDNNAHDINNANMSNSVFSSDDSVLAFVSFPRTDFYFPYCFFFD